MQAIYNQKDQLREEYHKAKLEFEIENDEIKHFEHLARVKETLLNREKAKQERMEARKQALADRPNPFLKELETCERLIAYCELLKKKVGLGGQTDESIKEEQKLIINEMAKEQVQQKLKEGKFEQAKSKREREEESLIQIGGRKKGGKKPKASKPEEPVDVFSNIDISILNLFGFLKVSPPMNKDALEAKITELKGREEFFNAEGIKRLKEEEEQVMQGTFEEPEEEEKHVHFDDRRGGRGGRGAFRGGRGGRGGARGGAERRRRDDDDDEVYHSSGDEDQRVSQKLAKRPSNKKENLNFDENNYPTL